VFSEGLGHGLDEAGITAGSLTLQQHLGLPAL